MAIPFNQINIVEVQMKGDISAGGSNNVLTNFVFHFRRVAVVVDPTKTGINTAFQAAIGAPIIAALNNRYSQTVNEIR